MKTPTTSLFALVILLLLGCSSKKSGSTEPVKLFIPESNDWYEEGGATWEFQNGILVGSLAGGAGFVVTKEAFQDFELKLVFNPDSTINSGVYVRCSGTEINPDNCYEINIWDLHPNQDFRTGAVVKMATPLAYVETLNQWNTYKIRCEGNRIQAWVNDIQTVDLENEQFGKGVIALQAAGQGRVQFKDVTIRSLK